jgi:hypothetical protein
MRFFVSVFVSLKRFTTTLGVQAIVWVVTSVTLRVGTRNDTEDELTTISKSL